MNFSTPYTNIKVPSHVAWLDTDKDIFDVLKAIVGHDCMPLGEPLDYYASIGYSSYGPYVEGDICFADDGCEYMLAYDFMEVGNDEARVFRFDITRV